MSHFSVRLRCLRDDARRVSKCAHTIGILSTRRRVVRVVRGLFVLCLCTLIHLLCLTVLVYAAAGRRAAHLLANDLSAQWRQQQQRSWIAALRQHNMLHTLHARHLAPQRYYNHNHTHNHTQITHERQHNMRICLHRISCWQRSHRGIEYNTDQTYKCDGGGARASSRLYAHIWFAPRGREELLERS